MRRSEYANPADVIERAEARTCKGCPHEVVMSVVGTVVRLCGLGHKSGRRCESYCKRTGIAMNQELDEIDQLLVDYYEWSQAYSEATGYGRVSASCRDFRSNSRQWMDYDEIGEEVDARLKAETGRAVEPMVLALPMRERIAATTAMRNFVAGRDVWRNPRYPETQDEDYSRAKDLLRPAMMNRGLIKGGRTAA